jgi:potassium intermediate/small conductance calcium-activated channel subfamily N protein 2
MAFAIRALRQNDINTAVIDDEGLENRQALIREEEARDQLEYFDSTETESEAVARLEQERKRKQAEAQRKLELQAKKQEKIELMRRRLKVNDTFALAFALLGTLVAFYEAEDFYSKDGGKERNTSSAKGIYMRCVVLVSSLFLAVCSARHYLLVYNITRERQTSSTGVGTNFKRSKYFRYMLLEVAYVLIHCPPGIDVSFDFEQLNGKLVLTLDALLTCIMLLRVFLIPRVLQHYSRYANEHSRQICVEVGCHAGSFFVLKALFKEKPYSMIAVAMTLSIIIFSIATRTFERPYEPSSSGSKQDYDYIWNSMWLIVLTMTTVGYGDFFPQTHMGRFVVIIACFWGVFIVSIMVVTLNETSKFSKHEDKAYEILERLRAKDTCMNAAVHVVMNLMRLNVVKRKPKVKENVDLRLMYQNRMDKALTTFRIYKRQWKGFDMADEEQVRQLTDKLDNDLEELRTQINYLLGVEEQLRVMEELQDRSLQTARYAIQHLEELIEQSSKE